MKKSNALRVPGMNYAEGVVRNTSLITRHSSLVQRALFPLAVLYGCAVGLRTVLYETGWLSCRQLPCRVESVGNLTAGGTGKTPVVIALVQWLTSMGKRVGVLSRGYHRTSRDEHVLVSDGVQVLTGPSEAGDEPHLIARRCPGVVVAVGADRYRLGRWVLERFPLDYLVLDDGFQHRALKRDVDLVLMDASDAMGVNALLPAGRLREPVTAAARADAVLVTRVDSGMGTDAVLTALQGVRLKYRPFLVQFTADCLVHVSKEATVTSDFVRGRRAVAVCGIGNPGSFRCLLEHLGVRVEDELQFPDHHAYTPEDVRLIRARAARAGADLVLTTEKDASKLAGHVTHDEAFWAVRLRTDMLERREELEQLILGRV